MDRGTLIKRALAGRGVQRSEDLVRIVDLPRRSLDLSSVPDLTPAFRRPGGTMVLRPIQSAVLWEAEKCQGVVGALGVGHGKSLCLLLLPDVVHAKRALLLVPPELKRQLVEVDIPLYSQHFYIRTELFSIVAYSELSSTKSSNLLEELSPDWVFADEAHRLKCFSSVRTKRFLDYFDEHPKCRFGCLTGSISAKSIRDFAHLSNLALRNGSPTPLNSRAVEEWAEALDSPKGDLPQLPAGALSMLCSDDELVKGDYRGAFRRRLVETQGWVATTGQAFSGSLYIRPVFPKIPEVIAKALTKLRKTWEIGEEELEDATALARVARQLACGFYYRWVWGPEGVDREWLSARAAWHKEIRDFLKRPRITGVDSPALLEKAAASGQWQADSWEAWKLVKDRPEPPVEAVWLSEYMIDYALEWAQKEPGIVWFSHRTLGERFRSRGFPTYGAGTDASTTTPEENPAIACSTKAQGEGKNLQRWSRNLLLCPPSGGKTFEQVIGRTHRPGQEADEVWFDLCLHTPEFVSSLEQAREDAKYVYATQGQEQKLLMSTFVK